LHRILRATAHTVYAERAICCHTGGSVKNS